MAPGHESAVSLADIRQPWAGRRKAERPRACRPAQPPLLADLLSPDIGASLSFT